MPARMGLAEIVEDLRDRIHRGEYPPGSRLPSYPELMELYSVSYSTIAKVILVLKARGLAVGEPGVGVFVPDYRESEDYFG